MAHHAYVYGGDRARGIKSTRLYAADTLGLTGEQHPDLVVLEFGLFSVDDAREVARFAANQPVAGEHKLIAIAATRVFHEAQNALLKLFEEPAPGTTLVLIVPSIGMLLPTLLSRVLPLPVEAEEESPDIAEQFLALPASDREKFLSKLVDRSKSDKDEEKQAARGDAIALAEGLMRAAYHKREKTRGDMRAEIDAFLEDITTFMPLFHERSAPLKLMFEHLALTLPRSL